MPTGFGESGFGTGGFGANDAATVFSFTGSLGIGLGIAGTYSKTGLISWSERAAASSDWSERAASVAV